mgnify:CR=1 FL=1
MTTPSTPSSEISSLFKGLLAQACCGEAWDMVVDQKVPINFDNNALFHSCLKHGDNRTLKQILSHETLSPHLDLKKLNLLMLWQEKYLKVSSLKVCLSSPLFYQQVTLSELAIVLFHSNSSGISTMKESNKAEALVKALIDHHDFVPALTLLANKFGNQPVLSSLYVGLNPMCQKDITNHLLECIKQGIDPTKAGMVIDNPLLTATLEKEVLSCHLKPSINNKSCQIFPKKM